MPDALLDALNGPADLRRLEDHQLVQLAEEIRHRIRTVVSRNGGHLASNLGVVELTLALHRVFDFTADRLLWDVGHQAYVHKLVTGRAERFSTLRQEDGLSGFPDPRESVFDPVRCGHSSTAISTAVGLAEADQVLGQRRRTVAVIGDGALTGGMAFEGLINAGELGCPLVVVLNDNGTFIDQPVGSLHKYLDRIRTGKLFNVLRRRLVGIMHLLPWREGVDRLGEQIEQAAHKLINPGYIFEDLGFRYFGPLDGHDRVEMERLFRHVANTQVPVLVHVRTAKGQGWQPSMDDPLRFHGAKGFDIDSGEKLPQPQEGRIYAQVAVETLISLASTDERLVAITAAMPSGTGLTTFAKTFPERCYDVGICEQHSFGFAQGLALAGLHPVLVHYSTFAQRGFDQLFQELVLQRDLGLTVLLDRAGLVGEDGESHQGLYDLAWARCLPGVILLSPKDGIELAEMIRWAHRLGRSSRGERPAAILIRYPKEEVPTTIWPHAPVEMGRAEVLRQGSGVMVWALGAMVVRADKALPDGVTLVNARFAKPLDTELLCQLASDHHTLITIEDHALPGGFGSALTEAVQDRNLGLKVVRLGVADALIPAASRERQLHRQGLAIDTIRAVIARAVSGTEGVVRLSS